MLESFKHIVEQPLSKMMPIEFEFESLFADLIASALVYKLVDLAEDALLHLMK